MDGKLSSNRQGAGGNSHYTRLFFRFVLISTLCACIPLSLIGFQIHESYFKYSSRKMELTLQKRMEANRDIIDDYFRERLNDLKVIMDLYPVQYLMDASNLQRVFSIFNKSVTNYEDLGLINDRGFHESYVGPYDLMANDYSQTFWFKELKRKEAFVSDLFLGYRNIPHIIIAVTRMDNERKWILRATINADLLNSKLKRLIIGEAGEAYLLNSEGIYQSAPRAEEKTMTRSSFNMSEFKDGSGVLITKGEHPQPSNTRIAAFAGLTNPAWLLVMEQDYNEFFSDRAYADRATWTFFSASVFSILIFVTLSMAYIVAEIRSRDGKLSKLNMQLVQAGKMAAVGQLAAGVAHEINNPIAVIQSEIDLVRQLKLCESSEKKVDIDITLDHIEFQVERCSKITGKLLGFSRRVRSDGNPVDINASIREVAGLFEKWASSAGIAIQLDLEENLPKIAADSFELGQVLVNLVGNAVDAYEDRRGGTIHIESRLDTGTGAVHVTVRDDGCGISPENLKSIFDPFFTTKPAGKGTGLGLSISYSIIKNLGGDLTVHSEWMKGTEFSIFLPSAATHHRWDEK